MDKTNLQKEQGAAHRNLLQNTNQDKKTSSKTRKTVNAGAYQYKNTERLSMKVDA